MEKADCVVVGAGVIGLACARALARSGREVILLEAANSFGNGISSRSSEVIHAGLYYLRGGLKARLCVAGRDQLYAYCAEHGIAHRRCGKLLVATHDAQLPQLDTIERQALDNGAGPLQRLSAAEAQALEPALACSGALLSPHTGIIDSHGLMLALLGDAEAAGACAVWRSPLIGGRVTDDGFVINVGGNLPCLLHCRSLVLAAGLDGPELASRIDGYPAEALPPQRYAKGHYFSLAATNPFSHLIYPLPEKDGLGIHLTLDLNGRARFGPDVAWIDTPSYDVPPALGKHFATAIRRYWPALPAEALAPDYAGIRPKIHEPHQPAADFRIDSTAQHGLPGLIACFGIESPGLTSALAIGDHVASLLDNPVCAPPAAC